MPNEDTAVTSSRILIYETSLSFLRGFSPSTSELDEVLNLRRTVDDYISTMTYDSVVGAIIESMESRQRVLESSRMTPTFEPPYA
ncbi:hypothetical protein B0H12DRAFT_363181 [Mycena haematopus]|nr:hypothetical protein B0H12DRAFT_363181 [Mycena haematopus]